MTRKREAKAKALEKGCDLSPETQIDEGEEEKSHHSKQESKDEENYQKSEEYQDYIRETFLDYKNYKNSLDDNKITKYKHNITVIIGMEAMKVPIEIMELVHNIGIKFTPRPQIKDGITLASVTVHSKSLYKTAGKFSEERILDGMAAGRPVDSTKECVTSNRVHNILSMKSTKAFFEHNDVHLGDKGYAVVISPKSLRDSFKIEALKKEGFIVRGSLVNRVQIVTKMVPKGSSAGGWESKPYLKKLYIEENKFWFTTWDGGKAKSFPEPPQDFPTFTNRAGEEILPLGPEADEIVEKNQGKRAVRDLILTETYTRFENIKELTKYIEKEMLNFMDKFPKVPTPKDRKKITLKQLIEPLASHKKLGNLGGMCKVQKMIEQKKKVGFRPAIDMSNTLTTEAAKHAAGGLNEIVAQANETFFTDVLGTTEVTPEIISTEAMCDAWDQAGYKGRLVDLIGDYVSMYVEMKEWIFKANLMSLCARLRITRKDTITFNTKVEENRGHNGCTGKSFSSTYTKYNTQITLGELEILLQVVREWGYFTVIVEGKCYIAKADSCFVMGTKEAPTGANIMALEAALQLQDLLRNLETGTHMNRTFFNNHDERGITVINRGVLPVFVQEDINSPFYNEEVHCPYPSWVISTYAMRYLDDTRTVVPVELVDKAKFWLDKWIELVLQLKTIWTEPDEQGWTSFLCTERKIVGRKLMYKHYKAIDKQIIPANSNVSESQKKGLAINMFIAIVSNTHPSQYFHAVHRLQNMKAQFLHAGYTSQWLNRTLSNYAMKKAEIKAGTRKAKGDFVRLDSDRTITLVTEHKEGTRTKRIRNRLYETTGHDVKICNRTHMKLIDILNGLSKSQNKSRSQHFKASYFTDPSIQITHAAVKNYRKNKRDEADFMKVLTQQNKKKTKKKRKKKK